MQNKNKYIINKDNFFEKTDNSLIVYNDMEAFVLNNLEKNILEYFNGLFDLYEISNILSQKYSNYNENEFHDFVNELIIKSIIVPYDQGV